ncbi:alpha/beta hydrolase [Actinoplanes sp. NPDC049596]|uniref:alpha/beta fold hydrolase n=1 Tax=unclassified Actinoplanes TaxID=2626549 RepID=UPI003437DF9D
MGDGRVLRYCFYGPEGGRPAVFENGSPSSRFKRPSLAEVMERSRLRVLVYDRPGYGGSTRRPGRRVADAAEDVRALADAYGWDRFALFGGSGGGPHALASAALLGERVTRCAVLSGIKPRESSADEATLRARQAAGAAEIMRSVENGGPEVPSEPDKVARDDPAAMARVRATFVDSMDGWVDDSLAFAKPWGFDPAGIKAPVGVWRGDADPIVPAEEAEWMLARIPGAEEHVYEGGHLPGPDVYRDIYEWMAID